MKKYAKSTLITLTITTLLFAGCGMKIPDEINLPVITNSPETEDNTASESDNISEIQDDLGDNQDMAANIEEQSEPSEPPIDSQVIIRELFTTNILPEYGLADLKQNRVIKFNEDWEKMTKQHWLKPRGVISAYIGNLDADAESELMVVYIADVPKDESIPDYKCYNICADIYEFHEDSMVKSDSFVFSSFDSYSNSKVIVSVVNSGGKNYIVYERSQSGVMADGLGQDYCALEYVDGKIYNAFAYLQTGGGSSDFEFTGYRYDKEKIINEKVLYSEWYETKGKFKTIKKGIEYLFGKYGIEINKKAFDDGEGGWVKDVYDATQISILAPGSNVVPIMEYSVRNYNKGYETGRYKFKAVGKDYTGLR